MPEHLTYMTRIFPYKVIFPYKIKIFDPVLTREHKG